MVLAVRTRNTCIRAASFLHTDRAHARHVDCRRTAPERSDLAVDATDDARRHRAGRDRDGRHSIRAPRVLSFRCDTTRVCSDERSPAVGLRDAPRRHSTSSHASRSPLSSASCTALSLRRDACAGLRMDSVPRPNQPSSALRYRARRFGWSLPADSRPGRLARTGVGRHSTRPPAPRLPASRPGGSAARVSRRRSRRSARERARPRKRGMGATTSTARAD